MAPTTHPSIERPEAVALMCDRAAHADRPCEIELVETHISWLFITDHFVYKLKKPVRFDFLDFSTPEQRHRACLDEVRLNCRLSPDVYLGILPITRTPHDLELAGNGEPVDWVVQMRRLPEGAALDRHLREGRVSAKDEQDVAEVLTEFYARLPAEPITGHQYRAALERHMRNNAAACIRHASRYERARIRRIFGQQLLYLRVAADVFDERAAAGRIVDGHGDLRPEHIYLESPPAIIDCIEFSPDLRRVDVLDDLGFLAMECDRLGHTQIGERIVASCLAAGGDAIHRPLLNFYKSYRALVRAKVALLRAAQGQGTEQPASKRLAHEYLDWAEHYAARLGPPAMIVLSGLMGSGKSTLAAAVAEAVGADVVSTDRVRRFLYGASDAPAAYGQRNYQASHRIRVYEKLFSRAARSLDKGLSVVLDGTFLSKQQRQQAAAIAQTHGGAAFFVQCRCPREVSLARLTDRTAQGGSESEGRADLFDQQAADAEPMDAALPSVEVDTTLPVSEQVQQVFNGVGPQKGDKRAIGARFE